MRVLNTYTGQFVEEDPANIEYAILSHTWNSNGEQSYKQLKKIQKRYALGPQPSQHVPGPLPLGNHRDELTIPVPSLLHPSPTPSFGSFIRPPSLASAPTMDPMAQSEAPLNPNSIWEDSDLSPKIHDACVTARANGYRYIWIDSCCIDKASSSELSEAINSMYAWYTGATVCYAYLVDVPAGGNHRGMLSPFRKSRWFTRGWTLQELIAPVEVVFLSWDWANIGSKCAFTDLIEEITGICVEALVHVESLDRFNVAQRLSWAERRKTTRVEDQAYSLLEIFDINMPTLYGEGSRAFRRLQEEIMQRIPDQSLFAWGTLYRGSQPLQIPRPNPLSRLRQESQHFEPACLQATASSALAPASSAFADCGRISATNAAAHAIIRGVQLEYTSSPYGIRTQFQLIPLSQYFSLNSMAKPGRAYQLEEDMKPWEWYLAILGCEHAEHPKHLLGRVCYIAPSISDVECLFPGYLHLPLGSKVHLFPMSPDTIEQSRRAKRI